MVGFSLKNKKDAEPATKKFGGFTLKKTQSASKISLKRGALGNNIEEDNGVKRIEITDSTDLVREKPKEIKIELKPNKTLKIPSREVEEKKEEKEVMAYGLNVLKSEKSSVRSEVVSEETSELSPAVPQDTKRKFEQVETDDEEPDYSKVSVDDFGLAFLKGLGYKPEDTKKAEPKTQNKKKKYGNQMGLGSA